MTENDIGTAVVDSAIHLHQQIGPGLLESVYEAVLMRKLAERGLRVQRQAAVPIVIDGVTIDEGFRADLIVEGVVILELKSVEKINPVHKKQLLTYLRLTGLKLGYLLNFGELMMKDGITRVINGKIDMPSV